MIMKAQELNVKIMVGKEERLVQNWNEISQVRKEWEVGDMALVAKINDIVNGNFEECHGYEHYLETELMDNF